MKTFQEKNKYIAVISLALASFSLLFISITLKGLVANILVQVDDAFYTQFLATRERFRDVASQNYSNVVLVGIDDRTLNKLGAYNPLKYRAYHIGLLKNILAGRPKAVVYDILFADPHDDPEVDSRLAQTMATGPVFSVIFASENDRSKGMFEPFSQKAPAGLPKGFINEKGFESISPAIFQALQGFGLANAYPDNDGLLRKIPIVLKVKDRLYPTLAFEVLRRINDIPLEKVAIQKGVIRAGRFKIPVDALSRAHINIDSKNKIREISFYDIWSGRIPGRFFKDKIVFIAAVATGLGDMKLVPFYGYIPGVKIHANLLLNMLQDNLITEVAGVAYYFLILCASLFYAFLFYGRRELSTIKKLMGYISSVALVEKFSRILIKTPAVRRVHQGFDDLRKKTYGIKIFFLLFSEVRKGIEPILLHLIIVYVILFVLFHYFNIFIKPAALLIELLIIYVVVLKFKAIDFSRIS
ncbi:MAG: CHASE2 domain-containing protein [Desulfobacterales bacterium]|nr:CHASE2 domain-containing protein [Desulfobacterales bacterium]